MGAYGLSAGKLLRAVNADANGPFKDFPLICQVLDIAKIEPKPNPAAKAATPTRYKLTLSDGAHQTHTMLATQLGNMVETNSITKGTIVQVDEVLCNVVQQRRVLILLSIQAIGYEPNVIGNPQMINSQVGADNGAAAPAPAAAGGYPASSVPPGGAYNGTRPLDCWFPARSLLRSAARKSHVVHTPHHWQCRLSAVKLPRCSGRCRALQMALAS